MFLSQIYVEFLYSEEFLAAVKLIAIVAGYSFLRSYNAITNYIYLVTERMSVYSVRNGLWFAGLAVMVTLVVPTRLGLGLVLAYFIMRAIIISLDPFFFGKDYRLPGLVKQSLSCEVLGFLIAVSSYPLECIGLLPRVLLLAAILVTYGLILNFVVLSDEDKGFVLELVKSALGKGK
ncbi:MAG: hypothetical protein ACE5KV_03100 [Thermoplasmata archaeon]